MLDKQTYAANSRDLLPSNVGFIKADIRSINKLEIDTDYDWIINFAAETHVDNAIHDATPFWETNVEGTYELARFALKRNIKFFHISTDEVFGEWKEGEPEFTEESPYKPNNMYAVSKAASDQIVRGLHRSHGLQYIITNCGNNYGAWQHPEKFIPRVLGQDTVSLHANGKPIRDWINVFDHVSAIQFLLNSNKINESYVIGARDSHSIQEVCEMAGKKYEYDEGRPGVDVGYKLNPAKLEKLGWSSKYKLENYFE